MNPSYKFTRQQRLLKATEYKYVFDKPYKSTDRYLTVLARLNARNVARLGLAITKKRARLAVDRNRIKRLIRENFRYHQSDLVGLDCVVLARNETKMIDNRTLLQSLQKHWQNLSIYAPGQS
jgi:ribonuclease P protein component